MKRSAGVTISAVLVFVGSGLTLLWSALLVLAFTVVPAAGLPPGGVRAFGLLGVVFLLAFAAWGIATGFSLLSLREWARISMLLFCGILLLIAVPGFLMSVLLPLPVSGMPNMPAGAPDPVLMHRIVGALRVVMAVLYALLIVLGAWWVYFFSSRPVKEQFRGAATPARAANWAPAVLAPMSTSTSRKRPVSITIIAYLTLVGACSFPILQLLHMPVAFLGFFYTGWKSSLIVTGYMAVQLAMAYGLLKLEPWGRGLAIYYFNFAIFNAIISVILPGAQVRYDQTTAAMEQALNLPSSPMRFPLWFGLLFNLPLIAIQLWFVVTRKPAFEGPRRPSGSL
ncbi:MAG: hypothetical protein WA192_14740 [Candidatus Acidiferrales bacterium]